MDMPQEQLYEVVSPLGEQKIEMINMVPRLDSLAGKTICEVINGTFKSDVVVPLLGELLKKKYPDAKVVPHTEFPQGLVLGRATKAELDTLINAMKEKGCDAVISGDGG
jgi:ABC-type amino acid transport substrate-binding protein